MHAVYTSIISGNYQYIILPVSVEGRIPVHDTVGRPARLNPPFCWAFVAAIVNSSGGKVTTKHRSNKASTL